VKRAPGTFREEQALQGTSAREFFTNHDRVRPSPEGDLSGLSIPLLLSLLGGGSGGIDFIAGLLAALERDLATAQQIARASTLAGPDASIDWGQIIAPMLTRCRVAIELRSRERRGIAPVDPPPVLAPVVKPSAGPRAAKRARGSK
jgi:hypothetical protein